MTAKDAQTLARMAERLGEAMEPMADEGLLFRVPEALLNPLAEVQKANLRLIKTIGVFVKDGRPINGEGS